MQNSYGKSSAESFVVIVVGCDRVAVSPHGRPARRLPHPCVAGRNVNKMTLKRFVLINDLSVAGNGVAWWLNVRFKIGFFPFVFKSIYQWGVKGQLKSKFACPMEKRSGWLDVGVKNIPNVSNNAQKVATTAITLGWGFTK